MVTRLPGTLGRAYEPMGSTISRAEPAGSLDTQSGSIMVEIASIVDGNALAVTNAQARPKMTARCGDRGSAQPGGNRKDAHMAISLRCGVIIPEHAKREPGMPAQQHLPRPLIERLAQRDIALLLLRPVAAASDGAVDYKIVAVNEGGLVAGKEHCGISDVLGQASAWDRLRGLVGLAHHGRRLLRCIDRKPKGLGKDAGGDCAGRDRVDADIGFTKLHRDAFGEMDDGSLRGAVDDRGGKAGKAP